MDISFVTRKIQKSMASVSILAILTSLVSFAGIASADTFTDVSTSAWYYDYVDQISDASIMSGYDNGSFGPNDSLTRDQAAKILVLAFDYPVDADYDAGFSDVSSSNTLEDYINTAALYDIVGGYTDADGAPTGEFGSGDNIDRASFAKMVADAAGLELVSTSGTFSDVSSSAWYSDYVETVYAWSIVDGKTSTTFAPGDSVSRAEAAKMTLMGMDPVWRESEEPVTSEGDLTVEVSDSSPDAMTIPSNATSVELAAWDFTANGGDVTIDNLSIHQYGITSLPSAHQVYLYEGSDRLTSGTTINSTDNEATFTYNIDIDSGDTRTISVRMDVGDMGTSTGEVGLEIVSASKVDAADASVDGDFPLQAAKHSLSSTDAGTVTFSKNGTVDNSSVGEDGATIANFRIDAATEAAGVEELGLYIAGSVSTEAVENLKLYVVGDDAEPIAEVASVDSNDVARFVIDGDFSGDSDECENSSGWCVAKGGSKNFYVTADFNTGRTDDTVKVYIDQNTDVLARGNLYGFGMAVTKSLYDGNVDACVSASSVDCSYSALEGGDITISSGGPSAMDIATNARDVSILDFTIVSVSDVTFDSFPISLDASEAEEGATDTEGLMNGTASNFTDIKIVNTDTGSALFAGVDASSFVTTQAGTVAITDAAGDDLEAYKLFTDDFEMSAGEELNLALTLDVANTATLDAMTLVGTLKLDATYPQLKDSNNKSLTNSTALVPTSDVDGKTMTVRTPTLALSLASTPVAGSNVKMKGQHDVDFAGFVFACGDASECEINGLTLTGYFDDNNNGTYETSSTSAVDAGDTGSNLTSVVGSLWLEDESGNVVGTSQSISNTTWATVFDSSAMDWTIAAGDTEILHVMGNLSTSAFLDSAERIAFSISAVANVTVADSDGNTITATGTPNTAQTTYVTTSAGGSLTVAVSSDTAKEDIAVFGTTGLSTSKFDFTSTGEAFVVTKLAVNNRQSAATTAALGDYDNEVGLVTISYENSDGDTETATSSLVSGTANFSGLDVYIPSDSTVSLEVSADVNTITAAGYTASSPYATVEFIDLALAFNNFEAIAQASGETYKADKIDSGVAADSDLDFGTPTFTDGTNLDINTAITGIAAIGTSQTLVINDSANGNAPNLPVGTLLCVDAGEGAVCDIGTDSLLVVTSWTEQTAGFTDAGNIGDTVVATVIDNPDVDFGDGNNVFYALPGTGYFTNTKQMHVYESQPTVALSSSSPTSANASSTEKPFYFTVTADSNEKVQVRAAQVNNVSAATGATGNFPSSALTGTWSAVDALQGFATTGGIGNTGFARELSVADASNAGLIYTFTATADLSAYKGISFWARSNAATNGMTLTINDNTDTTDICASTGTFVANTWTFVDMAFTTSSTTSAAQTANFTSSCTTGTAANTTTDLDTVVALNFGISDLSVGGAEQYDVDRVVLYTEKLAITATANDGDIDSSLFGTDTTAGAADNLVAYLKESGGATVATGYFYTSSQADSADSTSSTINFYPESGVDSDIQVNAGSTKTYYLEVDSVSLLDTEAGVDDPVQYSIDLGTSANGTVTAGQLWWYETNLTAKWLGYVTSTVLYSNALKY